MDTINEVLNFVENNPEYRAQIGVIKLADGERTFLTWAALHREQGTHWIPALKTLQKLNPSAHWVPLTAEELQAYLNREPEPAFRTRVGMAQRRA